MKRRLPILLFAALLVPASARAATPVSVFPGQGTPDASARTQISFRGLTSAGLGTVTVTGSSTGRHLGRLADHSDGAGASFVPSRPFRAGERVTVRAAGAVTTFTIARSPGRLKHQTDVRDPGGAAPGTQPFHTRPDLNPPGVRIGRAASDPAQGSVFVAPKNGPGDDGPMIVDSLGRTVWFKRMPRGIKAFDFRVQQYQGRPVLTWWQGVATGGTGFGDGIVYDTSYRQVARVRAGNGYRADLHEFALTPQGTAFLIAYQPVRSGRAAVIDSVVQEIDVKSGLVMFEWHGLGHVSTRESYAGHTRGFGYDYLHANSVDLLPDGNLLVSARNTNAIYEVDHRTGAVVHRYGGKRSDFRMAAGTGFVGQHDARAQPDGTITVFDNASTSGRVLPSRALVLKPDPSAGTVSLVRAYRHPRRLGANSQGNVQLLPNGDAFVGWGGSVPYFTEFDPSGAIDFEGNFVPTRNETYRAYRSPWSGRPGGSPDVAASSAGGKTNVWASWNGATGVAGWQVLGGPSADALAPVGGGPWSGFETTLALPSAQPLVAVRALGPAGEVLGTSKPIAANG